MVLNIFSLTIAITKRDRENSLEKELHNKQAKNIFEEHQRKVEDYKRIRHY